MVGGRLLSKPWIPAIAHSLLLSHGRGRFRARCLTGRHGGREERTMKVLLTRRDSDRDKEVGSTPSRHQIPHATAGGRRRGGGSASVMTRYLRQPPWREEEEAAVA